MLFVILKHKTMQGTECCPADKEKTSIQNGLLPPKNKPGAAERHRMTNEGPTGAELLH